MKKIVIFFLSGLFVGSGVLKQHFSSFVVSLSRAPGPLLVINFCKSDRCLAVRRLLPCMLLPVAM